MGHSVWLHDATTPRSKECPASTVEPGVVPSCDAVSSACRFAHRASHLSVRSRASLAVASSAPPGTTWSNAIAMSAPRVHWISVARSEEHTSELQSHVNLVCRLLLEKKNK